MKSVTTYLPALVQRIEQLTKAFALFGGLILMLLAGLTIVSVIGRTINAYGFIHKAISSWLKMAPPLSFFALFLIVKCA